MRKLIEGAGPYLSSVGVLLAHKELMWQPIDCSLLLHLRIPRDHHRVVVITDTEVALFACTVARLAERMAKGGVIAPVAVVPMPQTASHAA